MSLNLRGWLEQDERNNNVRIRDLVKVHHTGKIEVQALRGLNLDITSGELVSIIGPSGSGKSTLLNIIGGLDKATAGTVQVGEKTVTALSVRQLVDYRQKSGWSHLPKPKPNPHANGTRKHRIRNGCLRRRNAANANNVYRTSSKSSACRIRAHHKPEELSGGEQQRIAIAAALANDAPVLLADEPTGELDTANARIIAEYLVKINQELGKTIIMVTHDPSVARVSSRHSAHRRWSHQNRVGTLRSHC